LVNLLGFIVFNNCAGFIHVAPPPPQPLPKAGKKLKKGIIEDEDDNEIEDDSSPGCC
jgi:hypothetical protein